MTTVAGKVLTEGEGLVRYSVPGETLYFKVTDEETDGMLDYFVLDIQPKSGTPLHLHKRQHENELGTVGEVCDAATFSAYYQYTGGQP